MTYFGRFLLLFMVVLNVGFFYWHYRQGLLEGGHEPPAGNAPVQPAQSKRLLLLSELPAAQTAAEAPGDVVPAPAEPDEPIRAVEPAPEPLTEPVPVAAIEMVCKELGPLRDPQEAAERQSRLQAQGLTVAVRTREARAVTGYWVLMDGYASRSVAGEALASLQQDGVADVALVRRDGAPAISLGIYKNRSAAARRLAGLQDLDYPARIEEMAEEDQTYWLEAKAADEEALDAALDAETAASAASTELRVQPCT